MSNQGNMDNGGVQEQRIRADFSPGSVVFLIGMRFNAWWRIDHWLPVFLAMPKMLRELAKKPDLGLQGYSTWMSWRQVMVVQYWSDMDQLMRYATARDHDHLPAWKAFNRRSRQAHTVGIWHEAYEVNPETSHIVYRDMPVSGMAAAAAAKRAEDMPPQSVGRRGTGAEHAASA